MTSGVLVSLSRQVCNRHFTTNHRAHHHFITGPYFSIVQHSVSRWYKSLYRRMSFRCGVRHPWRVILQDNFSVELFSIIKDIVNRTGYGVHVEEAGHTTVMAFFSKIRIRNLFADLTGQEI